MPRYAPIGQKKAYKVRAKRGQREGAAITKRSEASPMPLRMGVRNTPMGQGARPGRESFLTLDKAIYNFRVRDESKGRLAAIREMLAPQLQRKIEQTGASVKILPEGMFPQEFAAAYDRKRNEIVLPFSMAQQLSGAIPGTGKRAGHIAIHELIHSTQSDLMDPSMREGEAESKSRKIARRLWPNYNFDFYAYPQEVARYRRSR